MTQKIFLNGTMVDREQAMISVYDHGLLYGDGVFEGIRAYNGRIFRLQEHLVRLYNSAHSIMLKIPYSMIEMEDCIRKTLRANNLRDAYIRLVVTRGAGDLGLDPSRCPEPFVFIIADVISLYPEDLYQKGLDIITASTRRNIPEALNPRIKSLNYLNNIMARIEALRAGVPEALMLNREGYVAECTGDNIFYYDRGMVVTPPSSAGSLEGITQAVVMDIARNEMKLSVKELYFTQFELYNAEEVFLTGTAAEVIPVARVDARTIGNGSPGPVTKELMKRFKACVQREGTPI